MMRQISDSNIFGKCLLFSILVGQSHYFSKRKLLKNPSSILVTRECGKQSAECIMCNYAVVVNNLRLAS